jgi:hypothetical protein
MRPPLNAVISANRVPFVSISFAGSRPFHIPLRSHTWHNASTCVTVTPWYKNLKPSANPVRPPELAANHVHGAASHLCRGDR